MSNPKMSSCDDYYIYIKEQIKVPSGATYDFTRLQNLDFNIYLKEINMMENFREEYDKQKGNDKLSDFLQDTKNNIQDLFNNFNNKRFLQKIPNYIKSFELLGRELNIIYKITINKQPILIQNIIDEYKIKNNINQMDNDNYFECFYINIFYPMLKEIIINPENYKNTIFLLMLSFHPNAINYLEYAKLIEYKDIVYISPTIKRLKDDQKIKNYFKENKTKISNLLDLSVTELYEMLEGINIDIIWEPTCHIFYVVIKTIFISFINVNELYVAEIIFVKQKYNFITSKMNLTAKHRWILDSNILNDSNIKLLPNIKDNTFEYLFFKIILSCVKYLDKNKTINIFTNNSNNTNKKQNITAKLKSLVPKIGGNKTMKNRRINKKNKYKGKNIKHKI